MASTSAATAALRRSAQRSAQRLGSKSGAAALPGGSPFDSPVAQRVKLRPSFAHSLSESQLGVIVVPVLRDNFAYVVYDKAAMVGAAVDPVEPRKVLAAAAAAGVDVKLVLTTHSHADHDGGNVEIAAALPGVPVVGGVGDGVAGVTREVVEGESIAIGALRATVIATPCHTKGHVCYLVRGTGSSATAPIVFTGDTLFVSGAGNFNTGTPAQMDAAFQKLAALDPATLVFCGHEYTTRNLAWAAALEPANATIAAKREWLKATLAAGGHSVPSTIGEERAANPFMHASLGDARIGSAMGVATPRTADAMRWVRSHKDNWGRAH